MFYTEIDTTGKIVRSQFVENENVELLSENNRLVQDQSPNPPQYDPQTEYAERQEPVLGDKVEYLIKKIPSRTIPTPDPKIVADSIIAQKFAESKSITSIVLYALTNYNATNQQDIANVFVAGNYLIKVANNQVSEYYESDVVVDGVKYAWVSKNTQTDDIIDKYVTVENGLDKYTPDATAEPVRTHFGGYRTIPDNLKPLLDNFEYKEFIQIWSVKSYGFIVEYKKQ